MDWKKSLKKTWDFLWNDDSIWSWLAALIIAFIIVKFIFFPLLSFALGTSLPLVVVESSSMHHPGGFFGDTLGLQSSFNVWWQDSGAWYQSNGISKEQADSWPLRTGLEKGDIVVIIGRGGKPEVGNVIVFNANTQYPIIHRIVKKEINNMNNQAVYSTKGDNNGGQLDIEKQIPENAIVGKAVFRIPKLGWLKLWVVGFFNALLR